MNKALKTALLTSVISIFSMLTTVAAHSEPRLPVYESLPNETGQQALLKMVVQLPMAKNVQKTTIDDPDYIAYVFYDPSCPYSARQYKDMENTAKAYNVQFNWLPVASLPMNAKRVEPVVYDTVRSIRSSNDEGVAAVRASMDVSRSEMVANGARVKVLTETDRDYGKLPLEFLLWLDSKTGNGVSVPTTFVENTRTRAVSYGTGFLNTSEFSGLLP